MLSKQCLLVASQTLGNNPQKAEREIRAINLHASGHRSNSFIPHFILGKKKILFTIEELFIHTCTFVHFGVLASSSEASDVGYCLRQDP